MEKIRWGVIGAGTIAVMRTIPAILRAEHAELTAILNTSAEKAESIRQRFGAKRAYTSLDDLLNDDEIDAVYIATPVFLHAPQARAAADHGKHVLCEKPLGLNADEALETVRYCWEKGVTLSVGFMMRYGTQIQNMKRLMDEGKIGQLVSASGRFSCWTPDSPGFWLHDQEKAGGGPIMDMGVHLIDLMQYLSGMRATSVCAMQERISFTGADYTTDDTSSVILRMENGAQFVVQTNFNIPDPAARWYLDFYGTAGRLLGDMVVAQEDGGVLNAVTLTDGDDRYGEPKLGYGAGQMITAEFSDQYVREIERFSLALLRGEKPDIDPMDAVRVQRVVDAAYESSEKGITVQIIE